MQPFPGARSILVVDGAQIHKSGPLLDLLNAAGSLILLLPPYSPWWQPAELFFNVFKSRLPTLSIAYPWASNLDLIDLALHSVPPASCAAFVSHCGYK
jgi:transposase